MLWACRSAHTAEARPTRGTASARGVRARSAASSSSSSAAPTRTGDVRCASRGTCRSNAFASASGTRRELHERRSRWTTRRRPGFPRSSPPRLPRSRACSTSCERSSAARRIAPSGASPARGGSHAWVRCPSDRVRRSTDGRRARARAGARRAA